jgi:hypothetical protein
MDTDFNGLFQNCNIFGGKGLGEGRRKKAECRRLKKVESGKQKWALQTTGQRDYGTTGQRMDPARHSFSLFATFAFSVVKFRLTAKNAESAESGVNPDIG